jgi:hypothetical protein
MLLCFTPYIKGGAISAPWNTFLIESIVFRQQRYDAYNIKH